MASDEIAPIVSDEIMKLWTEHHHAKSKSILGQEYYHREVTYCPVCETFARHSGIPEKEHRLHPAGCQCVICSDCRCRETIERDRKATEEKERRRKIGILQQTIALYRNDYLELQKKLEVLEGELKDLMAERKE